MRRLVALLAVTAACCTPAAASLADEPAQSGLNQSVVADNSQAGTVLALSNLAAVRASSSDAGGPTNLAQATAHDCTSPSQALAASFQIGLIPRGATTQAPQNVALAVNVNCSHCGSFAYAYQ